MGHHEKALMGHDTRRGDDLDIEEGLEFPGKAIADAITTAIGVKHLLASLSSVLLSDRLGNSDVCQAKNFYKLLLACLQCCAIP